MWDTGVGIAPENQERIFEEFQQVGGVYTEKREGTGLGLALAKKFAELHGGQLWVESEEGRGTRFYFTLPVDRGKTERTADAPTNAPCAHEMPQSEPLNFRR